jgi:hypothetical protein
MASQKCFKLRIHFDRMCDRLSLVTQQNIRAQIDLV